MTAILRVTGQSQKQQFQNYHRMLNQAKWSSRELSRILLHLLMQIFVPGDGPIVVDIDETIERRRERKSPQEESSVAIKSVRVKNSLSKRVAFVGCG